MSEFRVNAPVGLAVLAAGWLAIGAPTLAQTPTVAVPALGTAARLAADLERDGACADAGSLGDLRSRLMTTDSTPADIGRALAILAASPTACAPLRTAAATLAEAYPEPAEGAVQTAAEAPAAAPPVDPEEARRASEAALKFVVGPPPRHITRERTGGG